MNALATTQRAHLATTEPILTAEPLPPDRHPAMVFVASRMPGQSREGTIRSLNAVADIITGAGGQPGEKSRDRYQFIRWEALRQQHVAAIRARLMERYKPGSANTHLRNLAGAIKQAWKLGYLTDEEYRRAVDVKRVTGETEPAGRDLEAREIMFLVNACENAAGPAGVRDAAIIGIMAEVPGCRRTEVVTLKFEDYDPADGRLLVTGKRNKQRTVWLANGQKQAMDEWIAIRGDEPGPLFLPINKGGSIAVRKSVGADGKEYTEPMTSQSVYNMLAKRGKAAKLGKFTPHDLRRTLVGDLLDDGVDIATVAKIVGHSDVATTQRYDRRPKEVIKKAARNRHFPYRGMGKNS